MEFNQERVYNFVKRVMGPNRTEEEYREATYNYSELLQVIWEIADRLEEEGKEPINYNLERNEE